jgi:aspartate aminotransferase
VIIHGVSKTYAMTGWRVGWMIGPPDVIAPPPTAVARHLERLERQPTGGFGRTDRTDTNRSRRCGRVSTAVDARCTRCSRHRWRPAPNRWERSTAFPSFEAVLATGRFARASTLCAAALEEAEIALVPGEAFGAPGHARLSYALSDDDLVEGLARLSHGFSTERRQT